MAEGVIPVRLWHIDLIPFLPRQQLLGQWRECCLIAKEEITRLSEDDPDKPIHMHVLINRLWDYPEAMFNVYAEAVYKEMKRRGYSADWNKFSRYRINRNYDWEIKELFPNWHNDRYLRQCLYNLQEKADCGAISPEEWKVITDHYPGFKDKEW